MPVPHELGAQSDADKLIAILKKRGAGSFLRGWRRELDADGSLEVGFQEFCEAASRIGFSGDARELFNRDGDPKNLSLEELAPAEGALISRFRAWVRDTFGGPVEMYSAFDVAGRTRLTCYMFTTSCRRYGFQASDDDFKELFDYCNMNATGSISQEEVICLENDSSLRELAIFKAKRSQKEKHLKLMCWAYREDGRRAVSATHRLAQRPWLAENFEQLPMLVHHRRVERQRETNRRSLEARIVFIQHLRSTYGSEVRAWRRGLDPDCNFKLSVTDLRRYCRRVDLNVHSQDLWRSLDKDCDGWFRLEELHVSAADLLASFQSWAKRSFGSCAAIWDRPEMVAARCKPQKDGGWASGKKVLHGTFEEVLKALEWPAYENVNARNLLLSSLDLYSCSFISCSDLEWLDKWQMPVWLCAEPDHAAWEELRSLIFRIYAHPLKAWRSLLDTDNSNNVSWMEFKQACEKVKFKGNVGGAWRSLNERLASSISMREYDVSSAELLSSFKEWAETNFGSVKLAFKAIDVNATGKVSYPELKRSCQNLKWQGEVRLLFDCLDLDGKLDAGKRFISMKEVAFLDEWEGDPGLLEQAEDEAVNQALETRRLSRTPTRTLSSPGTSATGGASVAPDSATSFPSVTPSRHLVHNSRGQMPHRSEPVPIKEEFEPLALARTKSCPIANSLPNSPVRPAQNQANNPGGATSDPLCLRSEQKKIKGEFLYRTYHCASAGRLSLQAKNKTPSWLQRIIEPDGDTGAGQGAVHR